MAAACANATAAAAFPAGGEFATSASIAMPESAPITAGAALPATELGTAPAARSAGVVAIAIAPTLAAGLAAAACNHDAITECISALANIRGTTAAVAASRAAACRNPTVTAAVEAASIREFTLALAALTADEDGKRLARRRGDGSGYLTAEPAFRAEAAS
jgi:hypothetical protein